MQVPEAPRISKLDHISSSVYEAGLQCLAKAIWYAQGDRRILPDHPAAILGVCFHTVLAASHYRTLGLDSKAVREAARTLFDRQAATLYEDVHPLLREKFSTPERLPYYNLYRERAALCAMSVVENQAASGESIHAASRLAAQQSTEVRLHSADHLIIGRPDHIDADAETVIDYKSAVGPTRDTVSDPEIRQLRLYAYLAFENGFSISKGIIIRGDGVRDQIQITKSEADAEGLNAKKQLQAINAAIADDEAFEHLASPSVKNCQMCPCLPFCEAFWLKSVPGWADECGVHVEGVLKEVIAPTVEGVPLVTLRIERQRGTLSSQSACIEQIPQKWLTLGGATIPKVGDILRVVHARQSDGDLEVAGLRVDKALTSLWTVSPKTGDTSANSDGR